MEDFSLSFFRWSKGLYLKLDSLQHISSVMLPRQHLLSEQEILAESLNTRGSKLLEKLPGLRGTPVGDDPLSLEFLEGVPEFTLEVVEKCRVMGAGLEAERLKALWHRHSVEVGLRLDDERQTPGRPAGHRAAIAVDPGEPQSLTDLLLDRVLLLELSGREIGGHGAHALADPANHALAQLLAAEGVPILVKRADADGSVLRGGDTLLYVVPFVMPLPTASAQGHVWCFRRLSRRRRIDIATRAAAAAAFLLGVTVVPAAAPVSVSGYRGGGGSDAAGGTAAAGMALTGAADGTWAETGGGNGVVTVSTGRREGDGVVVGEIG